MHVLLRAVVEGFGGVRIQKATGKALPMPEPARPFTDNEFHELVGFMGGINIVTPVGKQ